MVETQETENPETKTDKSFFLKWILACAIGYAIGMPSGSLVGEKIGYSLWDTIVSITKIAPGATQYNYIFASALMGAILGGIISLCQWFVLRKYIQNATWWIWIGLVCNLLGIALNSIFPARFSFNFFTPTILSALLAGYLEWLVLRQSLPSNGWIEARIAINVITLIMANINGAHYPALFINRLIQNILMGLSSGFISGVISGFTLNSFINKSNSVLQSDSQTSNS